MPRDEGQEDRLSELWRRVLAGDEAAKDTLARDAFAFMNNVSRVVARHYCLLEAEADDILGSAVVAWVSLLPHCTDTIRKEEGPAPYLRTVVWNSARQFLRRHKKSDRIYSLDQPSGSGVNECCLRDMLAIYDDPASEAAFRELKRRFEILLGNLPKQHARIWHLYQQRYKYREIADAVGMTTGGVGAVSHVPPEARVACGGPPVGGVHVGKAPLGPG
ncbi:MAG: sigma-70 family RNA polymerase sigma factor [Planctomycetota bacterium]